jgi:hypothetical protein
VDPKLVQGLATGLALGVIVGVGYLVKYLVERNGQAGQAKPDQPRHWVDQSGETRLVLLSDHRAGCEAIQRNQEGIRDDLIRRLEECKDLQLKQTDLIKAIHEIDRELKRLHAPVDDDGIPIWYFATSLRKSIGRIAEMLSKETGLMVDLVKSIEDLNDDLDQIRREIRKLREDRS